MARRCTVCDHPQREEIDRALVGPQTTASIARRYSLTEAALSRHKSNHLLARLVKAQEIEETASADRLRDEVERLFARAHKLFDACDAWLTDPDDPSRYTLDPRSSEVQVVYTEENDAGEVLKRKASLSELLARVESGPLSRSVQVVEVKHADPRRLLLETASTLRPQIELLGRLVGELQDATTINVLVDPSWIKVRQTIVEALEDHPGAAVEVSGALLALEESSE